MVFKESYPSQRGGWNLLAHRLCKFIPNTMYWVALWFLASSRDHPHLGYSCWHEMHQKKHGICISADDLHSFITHWGSLIRMQCSIWCWLPHDFLEDWSAVSLKTSHLLLQDILHPSPAQSVLIDLCLCPWLLLIGAGQGWSCSHPRI